MTKLILLEPSSVHHTLLLRHQGCHQWALSGSQGLSQSDSDGHFLCSSGSSVPLPIHRQAWALQVAVASPSPPLSHSTFVCPPDLVPTHVVLCFWAHTSSFLSDYKIFWCKSLSAFST